MAVRAAVPVASVLGFSLTPSRYIAARLGGGAVLGIAANVVRRVAVAERKKQAPEALLELVRTEGPSVVTRMQVRRMFVPADGALRSLSANHFGRINRASVASGQILQCSVLSYDRNLQDAISPYAAVDQGQFRIDESEHNSDRVETRQTGVESLSQPTKWILCDVPSLCRWRIPGSME